MGKRANLTLKRAGNNPYGRARRDAASENSSKQKQRLRVKQELEEAMLDTDVPRLEAAMRVAASPSHGYSVRDAQLVLAELRSFIMTDDSDDSSEFSDSAIGSLLNPVAMLDATPAKYGTIAAWNDVHHTGTMSEATKDLRDGRERWMQIMAMPPVSRYNHLRLWALTAMLKYPPCRTEFSKGAAVVGGRRVYANLRRMLLTWEAASHVVQKVWNSELHIIGGSGPVATCVHLGVSTTSATATTSSLEKLERYVDPAFGTFFQSLEGAQDMSLVELQDCIRDLGEIMTRLRLPCLSSGPDSYNRKWFDRHILYSAGAVLKLEDMTSWDKTFGPLMRSDMKADFDTPIAAAKALHYRGPLLLQEVNCCLVTSALKVLREKPHNLVDAQIMAWINEHRVVIAASKTIPKSTIYGILQASRASHKRPASLFDHGT